MAFIDTVRRCNRMYFFLIGRALGPELAKDINTRIHTEPRSVQHTVKFICRLNSTIDSFE